MNCPTIREQIPLMVYGDLAAAETAAIEQHLAECSSCKLEYAALKQVREALDATPMPEVIVNPAQIVVAAAERSVARRWLRTTISCGLAASVLLLALIKLEIRIDRQQLIVSWGKPAAPNNQPDRIPLATSTEAMAALQERVNVLLELTHALARDVDSRDRLRSDELFRTNSRVDTLLRSTGQRLGEAQRDVDALYAAHFKSNETGAKP